MKRWGKDILAIILITAVVVLFFLPLFWPTPQLLVTPDFGKSDAWHFGFASKFLLWENLHNGTLPLWTDKIGGGFPMLAEAEIGTFFLPNLIFFGLIPNVATAYNVSLVTSILILAFGIYVWLRVLGTTPFPAVFGALTLALSGIVILQLPHIALLQGFSLLPWVMMATKKLLDTRWHRWAAILACAISQQVFAGSPQTSFITLLFASSLVLWSIQKKPAKLWSILLFTSSVILGLGLGAIQLVPSWEFLRGSTVPGGLSPGLASYFSFPLSHLLSFLHPFALGNPKVGTYPHFASFDGSIFWENTGYVGLLPLVLLVPALFKKNSLTTFFLLCLLFSFLLMWGSHSPLYIVYSLWPFSLFRVPSRFLWVFVTALVIVASRELDTLFKKLKSTMLSAALVLLVALNTIQLYRTWHTYHLLVSVKTWLHAPPIVADIDPNARIHSIGSEVVHNQFFLNRGWQDGRPYEFLRNTLSPDSNLVWGVSHQDVNTSRSGRRDSILTDIMAQGISVSTRSATISATFRNLLDMSSVTQLVTSVPLDQHELTTSQKPLKLRHSVYGPGIIVSVYDNPTALPRVYLTDRTELVTTIEDATRFLTDEKFQPGTTTLVEVPLRLDGNPSLGQTHIVDTTDTRVTISVTGNSSQALLVLTDTFYPGWEAQIDGVSAPILPVNIRYRGVMLPEGDHTVVFTYRPTSLFIGTSITLLAALLIVILTVFPGPFLAARTRREVPGQRLGSRRNRGRPLPRTR